MNSLIGRGRLLYRQYCMLASDSPPGRVACECLSDCDPGIPGECRSDAAELEITAVAAVRTVAARVYKLDEH